MKELRTFPGLTTDIFDCPIPRPGKGEVLIRVEAAGLNPKDWKAFDLDIGLHHFMPSLLHGFNQGDDIAGVVEDVGDGVIEFRKGDRVAAMHEMLAPGGSAIAWKETTFHIPPETSFEEAATIPLAGLTAAIGLFYKLKLPTPWCPAEKPTPLVIYGASTAVGSFAIKLAGLSDIHPIIAIAGRGSSYVETLLSRDREDTIIDYRGGSGKVTEEIKHYLQTHDLKSLHFALDAAIVPQSAQTWKEIISSTGHVTFTFPNNFDVSPTKKSITSVGAVHFGGKYGIPTPTKVGLDEDNCQELGYVISRFFTHALQKHSFTGHPFMLRRDGLAGVQEALRDLRNGKASATKYVVQPSESL